MKKLAKTALLPTALTLTLAMALALGGCGQQQGVEPEAGQEASQAQQQEAAPRQTQISEQVVLEEAGCRVTATGLRYDNSLFGPELQLLIENNGQTNLICQAEAVSVNGVMIAEPLFSCEIAAGKKANSALTLNNTDLETAGIEILQEIEFTLYFLDAENWQRVYTSQPLTLTTDAPADFQQAYDDSGAVVLEQNGVKVVAQTADQENSFWGADIWFYLENNTEQSLTIQSETVSVNGFMTSPFFSCQVAPGKKAYSSMTFLDSELQDNNITEISELELSFRVVDSETYRTVFDTQPVTISFSPGGGEG